MIDLGNALVYVEMPIYIIVLLSVWLDPTQIKEVFDMASLSARERRDVVSWTFMYGNISI